MKKILYILEAVEGGTWRHLEDLLTGLDRSRFDCEVVLSFERQGVDKERLEASLLDLGLPLHVLPLKRRVAPLADLSALIRIVRLIKARKPDLIHAHSSKAGILGRMAGCLTGVPVVYTPHAFAFLMQGHGCRAGFYRWVERWAAGLTSALICVSREELAEARVLGYSDGCIHYISNGIKLAELGMAPAVNDSVLKLGFFGRSTEQKGDDTFVRLIAELRGREMNVEGFMYGFESCSERLIRAISAKRMGLHIHQCGTIPQSGMVEQMRQMDVVVMPSRWEGLPYVLLEALAAGVPLAAYSVGGIPDVVENKKSAMLAEPGNFQGLADCIYQMQGVDLRSKLAAGGREALQNFSLEQMINKTESVYAGLGFDGKVGPV